MEDGQYHVVFVACDDCITPEAKDKMTHIADGWSSNIDPFVYELT
jgi:hypothetical protein